MYDRIQSFLNLTAVGTYSYHWGLNGFLGLTYPLQVTGSFTTTSSPTTFANSISKSSSCPLFNDSEFQHVITCSVTYKAHSNLFLAFMQLLCDVWIWNIGTSNLALRIKIFLTFWVSSRCMFYHVSIMKSPACWLSWTELQHVSMVILIAAFSPPSSLKVTMIVVVTILICYHTIFTISDMKTLGRFFYITLYYLVGHLKPREYYWFFCESCNIISFTEYSVIHWNINITGIPILPLFVV
jgi:hypothetical protein